MKNRARGKSRSALPLRNYVAKNLHKSCTSKVEESKKEKLLEEILEKEIVDTEAEDVYCSFYIDEWSEIK